MFPRHFYQKPGMVFEIDRWKMWSIINSTVKSDVTIKTAWIDNAGCPCILAEKDHYTGYDNIY